MVLILTSDAYTVAHYDNAVDKVTKFQRVLVSNIESIEFGIVDTSTFNLTTSFGRGMPATEQQHCLRIWYKMPSEGDKSVLEWSLVRCNLWTFSPDPDAQDGGFFHQFRSTNLRFFNNLAVLAQDEQERIESLRSVADSIAVAIELSGSPAVTVETARMEKKKSKIPENHPSSLVQQMGEG